MIIQADKEGQTQIQALCDIALKSGGLQNLPYINRILASVKPLPPQTPEEKKAEVKKGLKAATEKAIEYQKENPAEA